MEQELYVWDGPARRRAKKITCRGCGDEWLIRKDRKHSGYCRSCKVSGEKNPQYGKEPYNKGTGTWCQKKARLKLKRKIILYMGNKCAHCGAENLPMSCYTAHHVDPNTKVFSVMAHLTDTTDKTWQRLVQEMKKCDLLCIHCHKIHHYGDERAE